MELRKWLLGEVIENYDYLRKPLSSMERKSFKGEFPYYGAQGIIDYIADYRCDGEFLLIAEDGENLSSRNAPIAQIAKGKYWVNNHAHIVKNNNNSDLYYICYLLNNSDIAGYITGSAQPKLSQGNLNKIKIALPSLPIQQKIASILSTYDTLIENNNRRIRLLEQMAENLYKEWFVRFRFPGHEKVEMENGLPKGWKIKRIADFGRIETGKTPPMSNQELYGGDILFVKTPDMHEKMFVSSTSETLSQEGNNYQLTKLLPVNSIMVSCIGTAGVVSINAKSAHTNQQINSIILNNLEDLEWLYYVCRQLKPTIELFGATGATMTNLSKSKFEKLKIVVPKVDIRNSFHKRIRPYFKDIFTLEQQNTLLTRQRDLLLPRLMSGKLEVKP